MWGGFHGAEVSSRKASMDKLRASARCDQLQGRCWHLDAVLLAFGIPAFHHPTSL